MRKTHQQHHRGSKHLQNCQKRSPTDNQTTASNTAPTLFRAFSVGVGLAYVLVSARSCHAMALPIIHASFSIDRSISLMYRAVATIQTSQKSLVCASALLPYVPLYAGPFCIGCCHPSTMYNGIGLLTARGSGTSGHVQSNSFNIRSHARNPQDNGDEAKRPARVRKADDRILEHERKREIELKLIELSESLEDNGCALTRALAVVYSFDRCLHEMCPAITASSVLVTTLSIDFYAGIQRLRLRGRYMRCEYRCCKNTPLCQRSRKWTA